MRIDHIHIRNFRKLKNCRIDFNKDQTIFVGACGEEADQQMVGRTIGKGPCHGIEVVYKHITTRT